MTDIRVSLMLAALVSGVLFACGVQAEEINPVVGRAGEVTLRQSDVQRLIGYLPADVQQRLQADSEQRVNLVRQVLTTAAVSSRARKEGFDKRPEVMEQLGYLIDQFLADEYLVKVIAASATVPDEDLKKYYREHEQEFLLPEKIKARHIFIEVPKDAGPSDKAKALARAEGAHKRLKEGADFASVAKEVSDDADSAGKGGELGIIAPGKTNSEEFEKAAFALKAGETSGVVVTPFGYHLVRVDERQEKRIATFDESKEYIAALLKKEYGQKRVREFVDKSVKDAGLEIYVAKITGEKEKPAGSLPK